MPKALCVLFCCLIIKACNELKSGNTGDTPIAALSENYTRVPDKTFRHYRYVDFYVDAYAASH